jgi:hypothetical protein
MTLPTYALLSLSLFGGNHQVEPAAGTEAPGIKLKKSMLFSLSVVDDKIEYAFPCTVATATFAFIKFNLTCIM